MSHVVSIETRVRDIGALRAACRRLGVTEPVLETVQLFSGKETGYCVRLPEWRYPVAALPLVLCWYLLHGLRSPDEDVSEVLIQNLVSEQLALAPPPPARPAIEHDAPPALDEDPPF